MPTFNHVCFKRFFPLKPHKWGIEFFAMCDSLSGYLMNFKMYTGSLLADDTIPIVKQLLEPIADRQPHVCCDRGYTSGNVIDLVLDMNGELVGTIAANRFSKCFVPIPEGETQVVKFVTPQNNVVDVLEVHPRNKKQFNIAYTIASPGVGHFKCIKT
jgi:hypothetical protein